MYLERTFLARTGVVGLEFVYKNIKRVPAGFNFLLCYRSRTRQLIYTVCPIYYLVLPLTLASRRRGIATKTTTTTTTTKVLSSYLLKPPTLLIHSYPLQRIACPFLYPPILYHLLHALLSRLF